MSRFFFCVKSGQIKRIVDLKKLLKACDSSSLRLLTIKVLKASFFLRNNVFYNVFTVNSNILAKVMETKNNLR